MPIGTHTCRPVLVAEGGIEFIRGALFRSFFAQTRVFAIGGVFDCRGIHYSLPASACFLGRDPKRRDGVIWVGGLA